MSVKTVGLIGARGFTGREILRLLNGHEGFELAFAVSRARAGGFVRDEAPGWRGEHRFEDLGPDAAAARSADAVILATPNGEAAHWVGALQKAGADPIVLDISADHRFDDAWAYGLPELGREALESARRIANPGCYATALQLAAAPLTGLLARAPHGFAVSGWSGAGSTPGPRNDPERLKDNIMPYAGVGHIHEREASRQLGFEVRLSPHVAPFFRGIILTMAADLTEPMSAHGAASLYETRYAAEPLVRILDREAEVADAVDTAIAVIGAPRMSEDGRRLALTCAIDNLLKGAASQAVQNLNLAFGFDERQGLEAVQ